MLKRIATIGLCLVILLISIGTPLFFVVSHYSFAFLSGNSMYPTIPDKSFVICGPVREEIREEISVGQILIFDHQSYTEKGSEVMIPPEMGKELILHRVVKVVEDGRFVTKGDNADQADPLILRGEDIKGVYIFHLPLLGYFCGIFIWISCVIALSVVLFWLVILVIKNRRPA